MHVLFSKQFKKQLKKLSNENAEHVYERIELFVLDPHHVLLKNHPLLGIYKGYRSINITADLRAVFKQEDSLVKFEVLGTHSQLYK